MIRVNSLAVDIVDKMVRHIVKRRGVLQFELLSSDVLRGVVLFLRMKVRILYRSQMM